MKADLGLNLKQVQKLIMTPELKQAIEILQLNSYELNDLITTETENNPLLEIVENDKDNMFETYMDIYKYNTLESSDYSGEDEEKDEIGFDNIISDRTSLMDHLMFQLHITPVPKKIREICKTIIYYLDSNGYLNENLKNIKETYKYNDRDIQEALSIVQTFDPPGIAARNLNECLKLQLISKNLYNGILKEIVDNYLSEVGDNRLSYVAKKLNTDIREIQKAVDEIKKLNPKPGANFSSYNDVRYVLPDAYIKKINDEYIVLINDSLYPGLKINKTYENILRQTDDDNIKKYLSSKMQSALWLIKSIESRRDTLYKVLKAIVNEQREFFERGQKYIKPMNLKQIADIVGVHESTVSRAINGKFVDTPLGVYEIKHFFQNGIKNNEGEKYSAEMLKELIKQFIDNEDSKKPLSDQKIVELMLKKNISISRRTVTKYREELNIPSSAKRKRY
ncbi:RNA polymerase factor sigma-54 [Thermoanaerobacterium sp. RBIITD]|uniref:RNA polymerase factor sigma-54 n=1 Tax=Thermoanaerobacterium sp. RBIITD TaxID=1550240 RepID=UPI000BB9B7B9|nr:RNA polymerase factor sigma-54 [Thermoanaerobacterium sp. RBIITD]SNX54919.1 RNA polymerase, sigma 54 subunit, RpoN/SigL [Thermoanaerobacterium sp. RBIITD]